MNPLVLPAAPALPRGPFASLPSTLFVWLFVLLLGWREAAGDRREQA